MLPVYYTARYSCGAVYCNRSVGLCMCLFVGVFVGLLPRQLEIAWIDPHQTGFVGKGSDHLQLIKFLPSCAPGKGYTAGRIFLAPRTLLQPARSVCVSSERFLLKQCHRYWLGVPHVLPAVGSFTYRPIPTLPGALKLQWGACYSCKPVTSWCRTHRPRPCLSSYRAPFSIMLHSLFNALAGGFPLEFCNEGGA